MPQQMVTPTIRALRQCRADGMSFEAIGRRFDLPTEDVEFVLSGADLWRLDAKGSDVERRIYNLQRRGYSFRPALARAKAETRNAPGVAAPGADVRSAVSCSDPACLLAADRRGDRLLHAPSSHGATT